MNQRMEALDLMRRVETVNQWRETEVAWQTVGTVMAALSDGGGKLQQLNELWRIQSTHTALTWDDVKTGERLVAADGAVYRVEYAVPGAGRRLTQLYLAREEAEA